jgi:PKD domain
MYSRNGRAARRADGHNSIGAASTIRRMRVALVAASVLAGMALVASPAGAQRFTDAVTHRVYGVMPAIHTTKAAARRAAVARTRTTHITARAAATCIADNADCTALTYHGGAVMQGEKDYMLFWNPTGHSLPSAYKYGLNAWLSEVANNSAIDSDVFAVDEQFYDTKGTGGAKRFVPYSITDGGMLSDTDAYPASGCTDDSMPVCITDAQIQTEISKYVKAHSLPTGPSTEYFLFTPYHVGSCFDAGSETQNCAYTGYCGYHSSIGTPNSSTEIIYANMPWAYNVNGCDVNLAFGAGYANADGLDSVVGVWSHEASESMTDPNLDAWYQAATGSDAGYEDGDKCAYIYDRNSSNEGDLTGLSTNGLGYWNQAFGTDQYLMQLEWDQRLLTCERTNTDTQPTVTSVTPSTAGHGASTTFTTHATFGSGITLNHILWSWGDGTASTTTTGITAAHDYATAGAKTLTVIVTDSHGNEKKFTQTITVS